jgi:hypothetical protein
MALAIALLRIFHSIGLTPLALTRTRMSCADGCGLSTSTNDKTDASPKPVA